MAIGSWRTQCPDRMMIQMIQCVQSRDRAYAKVWAGVVSDMSSGAMCLLVIRRGVRVFALVHLAVASKVGYNREVAAASINIACKCCHKVSWWFMCSSLCIENLRFSPVWLYM
jgi:hypothetical protein